MLHLVFIHPKYYNSIYIHPIRGKEGVAYNLREKGT